MAANRGKQNRGKHNRGLTAASKAATPQKCLKEGRRRRRSIVDTETKAGLPLAVTSGSESEENVSA